MKKRVLSLFLAFVMVLGLFPMTAYAESKPVIKIVATNVEPSVEEKVTFEVYMSSEKGIYGISAKLVIPEGMTYVENSGALVQESITAIGGDNGCTFLEGTKEIWLENSSLPMTFNGEIKVATFECIMEAVGVKTITVNDISGMNSDFEEIVDSSVEIINAVISVKEKATSVPVTGINIVEENVSVMDNETVQLTVEISPENASNKNVIWTSNNEEVATVDETGLVTAVKNGSATITVTTVHSFIPLHLRRARVRASFPRPIPSPSSWSCHWSAE